MAGYCRARLIKRLVFFYTINLKEKKWQFVPCCVAKSDCDYRGVRNANEFITIFNQTYTISLRVEHFLKFKKLIFEYFI